MMVSSLHDGPSQASSTMHMPVPMEGFHNADPTPSTGHSYQHSQHHQQQQSIRRKRKAETQDVHNERLSKRLSLLNLEQNGSKLYVPVEQPPPPRSANNASSSSSSSSSSAAAIPGAAVTAGGDDMMLLDNTQHKVYIYNLDDELSSDPDSDLDDARLVFLPDVERHLRANRIVPGIPGAVPRPILPNKDGELAGMQLVLYDDGVRSVSVPEEQDSVRKAIIEARERHRRRQQDERDARAAANNPLLRTKSRATFATPVRLVPGQLRQQSVDHGAAGMASAGASVDVDVDAQADADAMEID